MFSMNIRQRKCKFALMLVIISFCCFIGNKCSAEIEVHFLDVGQGDCAIIACDGEFMIIDGGPPSASQYLYWYIREKLEINEFRYMIATHPHEDHIGGLSAALNAAMTDVLMTPVLEWDTRAFESMMKYADLQGTPVIVPEEGDTFQLGGATVTILSCWPEAWDANCMSIVCRVDYSEVSFLFTGDAEDLLEYILIDGGAELEADVLKVGHHGSTTSTTREFVDAVNPMYAVIMCGEENPYGHPRQETLDTLQERNIAVFRTDLQGTIIMRSDGKTIDVEAQKYYEGNNENTT